MRLKDSYTPLRNMKFKSIIIISICSILCSCQNSNWRNENNSIRPTCELTGEIYFQSEFQEIKENQLNSHYFWTTMNHSNIEVAVDLEDGELKMAEPKSDKSFFELEDGKLEIINSGEFGGALNFISSDNILDTISIWKIPINFVFEFKSKIYFLVGIAHGMDSGGALYELKRIDNEFSYEEVVRLDSAPEAVSIFRNKILIAGHQMFTVVENFNKDNIVKEAFWSSLYPNSISVKNEDEVYIGMRGGYAKLSLISKEVKYFQYRKE